MANSASDARSSELEIRKQLIEAGAVDVMIAEARELEERIAENVMLLEGSAG